MVSQTLAAGQTTILHSNPEDVGNNPATPFNPLTYTVDQPSIIQLTPSADSLTCACKALGPVGTAVLTISGQAVNFGPAITTQVQLVVAAGPLDHFSPSFDAPTN